MLNMRERLMDMPVMVQRDDEIEARYYNVWRRARQRWGAPMRFPLPGLKQVAMILDRAFFDATRPAFVGA